MWLAETRSWAVGTAGVPRPADGDVAAAWGHPGWKTALPGGPGGWVAAGSTLQPTSAQPSSRTRAHAHGDASVLCLPRLPLGMTAVLTMACAAHTGLLGWDPVLSQGHL